MTEHRIRKVVIVGGGTAGWMAAAAMSKVLGPRFADVTVVESDAIGIVGVGESTIPQMAMFNRLLGLDENDFIRRTQGTFKLGIDFRNWGRLGHRYIHPFGPYGVDMEGVSFHAYWQRLHHAGETHSLDEYSLQSVAGMQDKFMRSIDAGRSPLSNIAYAFHFDAALYSKFLRAFAEERGVVRREGKVVRVDQRGEDGFIEAVVLESGERIEGELFVDCTGFRGLLIEQTLGAGFDDWRHWLPTDSALAVQTESSGPLLPYTRAIARTAGWQWRSPLQHRVGNGLVFCSAYQAEEEARAELLGNLESRPLFEPRLIRYVTGRRRKAWDKNVVALGLASGFLEPLESTSIHLIQIGVMRLMQLFPFEGNFEALASRYNEQSHREFECIRDFLVLHYKLTEREDAPFWRNCGAMAIPDTLAARIELFLDSGYAFRGAYDLFVVASWLFVMTGQGLMPRHHHYMGALLGDERLRRALESLGNKIKQAVARLPRHEDFVKHYCPAADV